MKILMIAPEPFCTPRGTPLSVLGRLRALSKQGHEIHLLTYPMGDPISLEGLTIFRVPFIPFLKTVRVGPSLPKLFYDFLLFIRAFLMLLRNRYDLIHAHEEAVFFTLILSTIFRIRFLYDMHSNLAQQLENFKAFNFGLFRALFRWLQYKALDRSVFVITICPWLHKFVDDTIPGKPQALVENLLDSTFLGEEQEVSPNRLRRELNTGDSPVVVYVGTFEHYQGIELLIEAAGIVNNHGTDFVLVLVGGDAEQVAKMQALAEKMGVAGRIRFPGTVKPAEIPSFIELADILVSPRVAGTNTPSKVYGYLRSGKAIIATNLSTHTQVLTPEVSLLVDKTPEALSEGLLRVLEDEELRTSLGERALELAQKRYSQERYFQIMAQLMEEVEGHVRDLRKGADRPQGESRKAKHRTDV